VVHNQGKYDNMFLLNESPTDKSQLISIEQQKLKLHFLSTLKTKGRHAQSWSGISVLFSPFASWTEANKRQTKHICLSMCIYIATFDMSKLSDINKAIV